MLSLAIKMPARFGQMLCWGAYIVALICAALVAYFAFDRGPNSLFEIAAFGGFGALVWFLGRMLNSALLKR